MDENIFYTDETQMDDIQDSHADTEEYEQKIEDGISSDEINNDESVQEANDTSDISNTEDYETLVSVVEEGNQRLDTMTNCMIVIMVGVALVLGAVLSNIFSKYYNA